MFVLLMLQLLIIPTLAWCANDSNLHKSGLSFLAIRNNGDSGGLEITILNNVNNATTNVLQEQQSIHVPGHSLSSGCGDRYFRCQDDLLVETLALQDGREFEVVFIPLDNGILLLSHWCDANDQGMVNCTWNTALTNNYLSINCTPTVIYKINGRFYTVCINLTSPYNIISVLEVQLHLSGLVIENATLFGPLTEISISSSLSTLGLSNFIIVDHMIFFAIGNTIIMLDVFDMTQTQQYPELSQCAQINKLVYTTGAGNQLQLVAYCTDRYGYFDPVYGDWTNIQFFSRNRVPYLCPDNNYRATFFMDGVLQFSVRDSLLNTINNVNISSGICFESQNKTYFAYSDQQHNNSVYVYDFLTQNHYPVSSFKRSNMECPQLLLLENHYMAIRDATNVIVLDSTSNFNLVINMTLETAPSLFAMSHNKPNDMSTVAPPITIIDQTTDDTVPTSTVMPIYIQTNTPDDNAPTVDAYTTSHDVPFTDQSKSTNLQLALIIVGSIAALVVIINIIAITVYIFKRYRKTHR